MKKGVHLLFIAILLSSGAFVQFSKAEVRSDVSSLPTAVNINRNSITGFVFNSSRQPVSDVYVELQSDIYTTLSRTKTSSSGFFAFRGLRDGRYHIKVLTYGTNYEDQTRSVSLVSISAVPGRGAISEQVDFYLRLRRDANIGPLAAPGVIFAQEVPERAKKHYEEGINFLGDKKEKEGFESLKKSLEIFPDYFLALDRLGTEYVVRGYNRPAYVLLARAVEINPKSFSSTFGLGLTQFRLQEYNESVKNLKRATEIYNLSVNAHMWLGIALHQNGKLSEAETSLLEANKLSKGESAEVHWQLARLYNEQERYSEAVAELELFLKYNPKAKDDEKIMQTIAALRQKASER